MQFIEVPAASVVSAAVRMRQRRLTRFVRMLALAAACAALAACGGGNDHGDGGPPGCTPAQAAEDLAACVTLDSVVARLAALVEITQANSGSRLAGTPGDHASAAHVAGLLRAAGYRVRLQDVRFDTYAAQRSALEQRSPLAAALPHEVLSFSGNGDVTASVATPVAQEGCAAADFASFPRGHIALVRRGGCSFIEKATAAAGAGAVGMVVQNVDDAPIDGVLGEAFTLALPVVGIARSAGERLRGQLADGLVVRLQVQGARTPVATRNVIAEWPADDAGPVLMVGAHLDTVAGVVGANDNAASVATLLDVALHLARVPTRHAVRFAFWAGEENDLNGSSAYVAALPARERARIAAYLNLDMIASPNHVFGLYGGNGDADDGSELPGDAGARIRRLLAQAYDAAGVPWQRLAVDGRSDYAAFAEAGIPFGGLFTGGEELKTPDEARRWGGTAGAPYDACYHQPCDGLQNVNLEALRINAGVVARAVHALAMGEGGW